MVEHLSIVCEALVQFPLLQGKRKRKKEKEKSKALKTYHPSDYVSK
jgi:hypothetical protein